MKQTQLKVIALDFDGTIVESNRIKDRAFETIFSEWPKHKETIMNWHLVHDSIERREKFRYFVEDVLGFKEQNDLVDDLVKKFSVLTKKAIINCPFVIGVQNFIKFIKSKFDAVYFISATPQSDLNEIIEQRGLGETFKDVYGAPIDKVKILKKIMLNEKISSNEILFIGDSPEDQQAAESLGIHFIGRQSDRSLNRIANPVYPEFVQIKKHFKEKYNI